jgi:cell division septal protein FtsQ
VAAHDPALRRVAARHAAERRWRKRPNDKTGAELAEAQLTNYIRKVVAVAPQLTDFQVERLSTLLRDVSDAPAHQPGDTVHREPDEVAP